MNKRFFTTCGLITLMAAAPAFAHNQGTTAIDSASFAPVITHGETLMSQTQQGTGNVLLAQVHVRQEDRRIGRQADRQMDRRADRRADRQMDRRADRRADRQVGRQADRQMDRRPDRGGRSGHR